MSRTSIFLCFWWAFATVIGYVNIENVLLPSVGVNILFFSFTLSFAIGAMTLGTRRKKPVIIFKISQCGKRLLHVAVIIHATILIIILLRYGYYELMNYFGFLNSSGQIIQPISRASFFSPTSKEASGLFGVFFTAINILKSFLSVFVLYALLYSLTRGNRGLFLLSMFALLFESILFIAKGVVVSTACVFLIFLLLRGLTKPHMVNVFLSVLATLGGSFVIISFVRHHGSYEDVFFYFLVGQLLLSSALEYSELTPHFSDVNIIFSGAEYLYNVVYRGMINTDFLTSGYLWVKSLDNGIVLREIDLRLVESTTFFTLLSEPYLFAGPIGVIGCGLILGRIISYSEYRFIVSGCDLSLFYLHYTFLIVFMGIFGSPFSTVTFWMVVAALPAIRLTLFDRVTASG